MIQFEYPLDYLLLTFPERLDPLDDECSFILVFCFTQLNQQFGVLNIVLLVADGEGIVKPKLLHFEFIQHLLFETLDHHHVLLIEFIPCTVALFHGVFPGLPLALLKISDLLLVLRLSLSPGIIAVFAVIGFREDVEGGILPAHGRALAILRRLDIDMVVGISIEVVR